MSLFAGTGFFTQSAVLFPTSIEKNKKTEACSRDPQASSLLHGKGRHRRPFFTRGGRQTLLGGGRRGCGLQNRSAGLHLPCKSAGNNRPRPNEGLGCPGGGWGRMPGQCCPRGSALSPKGPQSPDPAKQPLPHPSSHRFLGPWPQYPLGRGRALTSPYSPPIHLWQRGLASHQRPLATCGVEARTGRVQRSLGNTDPKLLGLSGRLRVQSA